MTEPEHKLTNQEKIEATQDDVASIKENVESMKDDSSFVEAVMLLRESVDALHASVKNQYVQREEIEQFVTKKDRKKRVIFATLIVIAAMFGASFIVLGITGYCFLGGEKKTACVVLPNYNSTMDRIVTNKVQTDLREQRVDTLEELTKALQKAVDDLNSRVDTPPTTG